MARKISKEEVLQFMTDSGKPLPFRELASKMNVPRNSHKHLKRALRDLTDEGLLLRTRNGLYGPSQEMDLITGYFEAHRDGFGFVIQEKPGERDVFVPARAKLNAMDNDRVVVRIENARKRLGRIIRILERGMTRIAGTVEMHGGAYFVKPKKSSVPFEVLIPADKIKDADVGQSVIVEIIEYAEGNKPAMGKVVKLLTRIDSPKEEVEAVLQEFGLPRRFPAIVSEAARALKDKPFGKRKDLMDMATVTIDGETAKDFDDAVSIKRDGDGYVLWVHIADVSHYVGWDDIIDQEARNRGTSVYFPGKVIPMLPKELSEDLCSLRPDEPRPAFTAEIHFSKQGKTTAQKFYKSLIKSNARMTYTAVAKIIVDGDEAERAKYPDLLDDFDLMEELARVLRKRRMNRGSLDFDLPEPEIILDIQGVPENIISAERNFAHMLIEEFMIAANEAVARHIEDLDVPSLYRIHEEPDMEKVEDIVTLFPAGIKKGRKRGAQDLHLLLAKFKGKPEQEALMYMVLRALKQARYSPHNVGHFGLASESYSHFTSPIRRYPDLIVHRVLNEILLKGKLSPERIEQLGELMPEIAFHSSRRERVAVEAERTVIDAMRAWFMKDKVGEEFSAKIHGVTPRGIRVRLDLFYVEGFIKLSDMTDDYYNFIEGSLMLKGRNSGQVYRLAQKLNVRVDLVDLEAREIKFGIISE
jgi:ribonuclease R